MAKGLWLIMILKKLDLLYPLVLISWEIGKVEDMIVDIPKVVYRRMEKCPDIYNLNPICLWLVPMLISVLR